MIHEAADLRRVDGIIWSLTAASAGAVLLGAALLGFTPVWRSFLGPAVAVAIFVAAQHVYRTWRPDARLAAALGSTAQIIAFAAIGAPLSYVAASFALPLQDHWFDAADRALGLDWPALLAWMNANADFHPLFREIYLSLMPQTVLVILALALAGRFEWLRIFVLAFVIAALLTVAMAAVVPAEGVWGFYALKTAAYPDIIPATREIHLPIFHGLREGSYRLLMADGAEGIITFPSLHAALAVLLTAGLWPIPLLRWVALVLNTLMLVSIPVDGGHYFIDVAAGLAIAWASLVSARRIAGRACQPRTALATADVGLVTGK
jgi:membrane-associated phospholipid phosphatase